MAAIDLKLLVGRLNEQCRRALEAAAGLTLSRSHYNVEIEHWLLKLIESGDTDIPAILRHCEIDPGRVLADLNRSLDRLRTGNARAPGCRLTLWRWSSTHGCSHRWRWAAR